MLRKMKPGQPGTKQFVEQYGDRLVCVRYRYNAGTHRRVKTVEIIVAETEWHPRGKQFTADEIVWLRTGFVDRVRQGELRAAGGTWDSKRCVWNIRYDAAVNLGLTDYVERRNVSP